MSRQKQSVGLRFKSDDAFGIFAEALVRDDVPFRLTGFETILIDKTQLTRLRGSSAKLYKDYEAKGLVEVLDPPSVEFSLLTDQEATKLLEQFAKEL